MEQSELEIWQALNELPEVQKVLRTEDGYGNWEEIQYEGDRFIQAIKGVVKIITVASPYETFCTQPFGSRLSTTLSGRSGA